MNSNIWFWEALFINWCSYLSVILFCHLWLEVERKHLYNTQLINKLQPSDKRWKLYAFSLCDLRHVQEYLLHIQKQHLQTQPVILPYHGNEVRKFLFFIANYLPNKHESSLTGVWIRRLFSVIKMNFTFKNSFGFKTSEDGLVLKSICIIVFTRINPA